MFTEYLDLCKRNPSLRWAFWKLFLITSSVSSRCKSLPESMYLSCRHRRDEDLTRNKSSMHVGFRITSMHMMLYVLPIHGTTSMHVGFRIMELISVVRSIYKFHVQNTPVFPFMIRGLFQGKSLAPYSLHLGVFFLLWFWR